MTDIRILIKPEDVFDYYNDNKDLLVDNMEPIAHTDTDDFENKSFLFVTDENGTLFLSLEAPDCIVNSEYCSTKEATIIAVNRLLDELKSL